MTDYERRLERRASRVLIRLLKAEYAGMAKKRIKILDLSSERSIVVEKLKQNGFSMQRLKHGQAVQEPLDLILSDGSNSNDYHLKDLLESFKPGFQCIVWNTSVSFKSQVAEGELNPEQIGLFMSYRLNRWWDVVLGKEWIRWISKRPVLKIRSVRVV